MSRVFKSKQLNLLSKRFSETSLATPNVLIYSSGDHIFQPKIGDSCLMSGQNI